MADKIQRGTSSNLIKDDKLKVETQLSVPVKDTFTTDEIGSTALGSTNRLKVKGNDSTVREVANKEDVDLKADLTYVNEELGNTVDYINSGLALKENSDNKQTDLTASATKFPTVNAVNAGLALKANLASPTFTGTPLAPTPTTGDNSTKIATTAFVKDAADRQTGWAQYVDTVYTVGSPLSVAAAATVTLTNNAGTSNTTQLPTGVTNFFDTATSKITPQNSGDYYNITVRFKAKNTEANGGYFDFGIDLGGAIGVVFKESKLFIKGANTEQQFVITVNAFSGATFVANGGIMKITGGNGTTTIYDIDLHVNRTHKAK